MDVEIQTPNFQDLTPAQINAIKRLSLRYGSIKDTFHTLLLNKVRKRHIVLALINEKIVGWGILYINSRRLMVQLYVHSRLRRKGIGTAIFTKLKELAEGRKINVYRTIANEDFFNKML